MPTGTYADPNYTASPLGNVRDRILSFVDATGNFNGNSTVLAWPPADPPAIPITATPLAIPCALGGGGGVNAPAAAVNDSATTLQNVPVVINVIANDTGSINPASVVVASAPANGSAVAGANGTVTYTPIQDFTGSNTFTYTVQDSNGAVSNAAAVAISVRVVETVSIRLARVLRNNIWVIDGFTSLADGNSMTIQAGDANGPVIGTVPVRRNGGWRYRGPSVPGDGVTTVTVVSSFGNTDIIGLR